jgi:hypothetical protein
VVTRPPDSQCRHHRLTSMSPASRSFSPPTRSDVWCTTGRLPRQPTTKYARQPAPGPLRAWWSLPSIEPMGVANTGVPGTIHRTPS